LQTAKGESVKLESLGFSDAGGHVQSVMCLKYSSSVISTTSSTSLNEYVQKHPLPDCQIDNHFRDVFVVGFEVGVRSGIMPWAGAYSPVVHQIDQARFCLICDSMSAFRVIDFHDPLHVLAFVPLVNHLQTVRLGRT
jgi:hypothetical protein